MEKTVLQSSSSIFNRQFIKYFAIAQISAKTSKTYIANLIARSSSIAIRMWIYFQIYQATYLKLGISDVHGITLPMLIWIQMIAQSAEGVNRPSIDKVISEEIQSGELAYVISRPYSYPLFHAVSFIGRSIPVLLGNVTIGIITVIFLVGSVSFSVTGIALGTINLLLGFVLHFSISLLIGLTALWLEDPSALRWIYNKAQLVFGGVMLPLTLFPERLRQIVEYTPFAQLYYSAAQQIIAYNPSLFLKSLLIQIVWLIVISSSCYLFFQYSKMHLSTNGG